jgi:hypothetical protein
MSHQVLHNAQSLEVWIQHDSHHVVSLPFIKKPQKLQKRFNYLYHLQPHVLIEKEDLNLKLVKHFRPTRKLQQCNFHFHSKGNGYCQGI